MTAPDDLIRRGDAERAAISYHPADGSCCHEDPTGHHAAVWACDGIAERIRTLPADLVAEAAGKLAEAVKPPRKSSMVNGYSWCAICQRAVSEESVPPRLHATGCEWVAYRAAVAARAKETA